MKHLYSAKLMKTSSKSLMSKKGSPISEKYSIFINMNYCLGRGDIFH